MDAMRLVVLAIAIVAAGAAAFLVRGLVSDGGAPTVQAARTDESVRVLVAARNLERGDRLTGDVLQWRKWPENAVSGFYITDQGGDDVREALSGAIVRSLIVEGEPILEAKIVRADDAGLMAALLKPGMRAIALEVSPRTAAGGFILPEDHVDIIVTQSRRTRDGERIESSTILKDIRVLAVDQSFRAEESQDVALGETITLELSGPDSERLLRGQRQGEISLVLRSLTAGEEVEVRSAYEDEQGRGVRIVRYGRLSN